MIIQNDCISTGKNHFKYPSPFRQAIHKQSQLRWLYFFPLQQEAGMCPRKGFPLSLLWTSISLFSKLEMLCSGCSPLMMGKWRMQQRWLPGHLFILQKLASLRNLITAQQMDKGGRESGSKNVQLSEGCHRVLVYNNPKKRVNHSLLIYSFTKEVITLSIIIMILFSFVSLVTDGVFIMGQALC